MGRRKNGCGECVCFINAMMGCWALTPPPPALDDLNIIYLPTHICDTKKEKKTIILYLVLISTVLSLSANLTKATYSSVYVTCRNINTGVFCSALI